MLARYIRRPAAGPLPRGGGSRRFSRTVNHIHLMYRWFDLAHNGYSPVQNSNQRIGSRPTQRSQSGDTCLQNIRQTNIHQHTDFKPKKNKHIIYSLLGFRGAVRTLPAVSGFKLSSCVINMSRM